VVLLILTLPLLLVALGLGTVLMPFGGPRYAAGFGLLTIVVIVQLGLMVAALPGLFARKMSGGHCSSIAAREHRLFAAQRLHRRRPLGA